MSQASTDFDIAFSFAGDHRVYVAEVAAGLRTLEFSVFYDQYRREDMLGQDLIPYLQDIHSRRSATVAAFISEQWVARPWPGHERKTALAHALLQTPGDLPFLLPFRFDETPVPGLQPSVGFEDLRQLYPGERRWTQDSRYKNPKYVVSLLARVLTNRRLGPGESVLESLDTESVIAVHFVWIEGSAARHSVGAVPLLEYEEGVIEFHPDEVESGSPVAGRYIRIADQLAVAVDPNQRLPVFLAASHETLEKSWLSPMPDPSQEAAVVDQVRRQVQQAVEAEMEQGAIPIGPTFTQSHETPYGSGVMGTCVLARPAR